MRSREATRQTLDQVTDDLTEAMDALADFAAEVDTCGERARDADTAEGSKERDAARRALVKSMEEITRSMVTTKVKVTKLNAARLRLRLRFDDSHAVYRNFDLTCNAVLAAFEGEVEVSGKGRTDDERTEAQGRFMEVAKCLGLYSNAVWDWHNSVIEPANLDH
jgi:hypothetical protein